MMDVCCVPLFMEMFSQYDHPIVLKFHQQEDVIILFNSNDQDSNMNFIYSCGLGTIY